MDTTKPLETGGREVEPFKASQMPWQPNGVEKRENIMLRMDKEITFGNWNIECKDEGDAIALERILNDSTRHCTKQGTTIEKERIECVIVYVPEDVEVFVANGDSYDIPESEWGDVILEYGDKIIDDGIYQIQQYTMQFITEEYQEEHQCLSGQKRE